MFFFSQWHSGSEEQILVWLPVEVKPMTLWTESESEESERFHFFQLRLWRRLLPRVRVRVNYDLVKTILSVSEAEAEG